LSVAGEHRNATIVAALIASMTFAAALLLWLEPPTRGWQASELLMAANGETVRSVTIYHSQPGIPVEPGLYDCIVFPDGECRWEPRGNEITLLVIGTPEAALPHGAARTLLSVLGNLTQGGRMRFQQVTLAPENDPRLTANLPPQTNDLFELLSRKGVLR
jgi:hypothetical protein